MSSLYLATAAAGPLSLVCSTMATETAGFFSLFAGTFYVLEVEFPANTFLISAWQITFSTSVGPQGFQKNVGKQQLSKLF